MDADLKCEEERAGAKCTAQRMHAQVPTALFKEYASFYSTYISFSTAGMEKHAGFLHP